MCSLKPYHQKIETLSQLVDIIVHEVEEGKLMLEIVAFVKEQEIVEECQYELEKSISLITEQICNAKSIKKEELLDTLQKRNVTSNSEDASLLTLITVVELSSMQYSNVVPETLSVPIQDLSDTTPNKETGKRNIEEDTNLKVEVHPQVEVDNDVVPKFKKQSERIKPSNISSNRSSTQVLYQSLDCLNLTLVKLLSFYLPSLFICYIFSRIL